LVSQSVVARNCAFPSRHEVRAVFPSFTCLFRSLNYSAAGSPQHTRYADEIEALVRAHATSR
jgi:hypothetical protein